MDILLRAVGRGFLPALLRVFTDNTLGVVDPGIYPADWRWGRVYEGDLYDALWQWRGISVGENYDFSTQCPNPNCRKKMDFTYAVSEVARKPIPEVVLANLREGRNRISADFSGGSFVFIIPTADESQALANTSTKRASAIHQRGAAQADETDTSLIKSLRQKLMSVTVEGTTYEGGKLDRWLDEIDLDIGGEIIDIIEENSFGIDTAVDLVCGNCGGTFPGEIPMQKSFFLSRGSRRPDLSPTKTQ
ncbi:MAG: hypothetical protein Q7U75_02180 [Desulfobacterales bacterium]|nr:hypothetical protein [Desulfobacterales bacterium]